MAIHRTEQEKSDLIKKWQESNLSQNKFCYQEGVNPNTFRGWIKAQERAERQTEGNFLAIKMSNQQNEYQARKPKLEMEVSGVIIRIY